MNIKKAAAGAVLVLLGALLPGCATRPRDFSSYAPLGLISVVSNNDINWIGEETRGPDLLGNMVRKALKKEAGEGETQISKADALINDAEQIIRDSLTGAGVFGLADKEQVLGAPSYAAAGREKPARTDILAQGFRDINYWDKKSAAALSAEAGLRSLLYAAFEFTKEMTSGLGKSGKFHAKMIMKMTMISPGGKVFYRKTFELRSSSSIPVSSGVYNHEDLMDLFKETITEACVRFVQDFAVPGTGSFY